MARTRSPNYPVMSLKAAIEAARPIFKEEGRVKMARLTVAKHLGYNSLNGRSLGRIGALRAYGILDGSGEELRISDGAVALMQAPEDSPERKQALKQAISRLALFAQINEHYENARPSSENLQWWLVQNKFTQDAAEKAAQVYLDNYDLASPEVDGYTQATNDHAGASDGDGSHHITVPSAKVRLEVPKRKPALGMVEATLPLEEGQAILQWPDTLSPHSYQDFEDWVELMLRRAKRSVVENDSESTD